jgi:hypothetical protein
MRQFSENGRTTSESRWSEWPDKVHPYYAHFGELKALEGLFPRIDSWQNVLSNKICALSRLEPKDFVDIFFIALKYPFDWEQIISEAREKDLWVEPITVSRLVLEFPLRKIKTIKWIKPVNEIKLLKLIEIVSGDILKGHTNSVLETGDALSR